MGSPAPSVCRSLKAHCQEAMVFGDLDDSNAEVAVLAGSPRAFRWMEELGTRPKVVYLREGE